MASVQYTLEPRYYVLHYYNADSVIRRLASWTPIFSGIDGGRLFGLPPLYLTSLSTHAGHRCMSSQNCGPLPESAVSDSAASVPGSQCSWETGLLTSMTGVSCLWVVGRPSSHNCQLNEPSNQEREGRGWRFRQRADSTVPDVEAGPSRPVSAF